ncbi:tRNA lysidine(34) synthetase TilS [Clostridium lundense]|uniref:tRNA lysidine(34) synthetase TilS n=1 Tax=Clostridium lundense TaxID=319475 RepID=UPI000484F06C|nr:tRNA lysidine(34) synthetase TilS [Clostridium lundense]
MMEKILNTIEENNMIKKGDKIVVGVSGGPDSMCLLHILNSISKEYCIEVVAAHINHCLRGEEADKDEEYVREFCKINNLDFYSTKVDINKLSKEKNLSCETAGREARYSFFKKIMKDVNGTKVALAHNANDQCETILMRIMRGTGIEGLAGIKPVRDNIYIRPLINTTRSEIEEYCILNKLNPRIDKTNLETIYTRNKVRLELIPYIRENFNKDIIGVINRLSMNVDVDRSYIESMAEKSFKQYTKMKENRIIILKDAFCEHRAIVTRIIRYSINYIKGNLYNYEKVHIDGIIDLQKNETGKEILLPGAIKVINNYGDIHIFKYFPRNDIKQKDEYILRLGNNYINNDFTVELELLDAKEITELDKNDNIKYFDFDKINGNIVLRYRKDGDRFTPIGMKGSKKLKDFFIDLKVPKEERNKIPLICFNNDIAWIVGYRVSENFKVKKTTKNILKIKIEREEIK